MSIKIEEHLFSEKKFLHDLCNKLVTIQAVSSSLLKSESGSKIDEEKAVKLKKSSSAIITIINERRDYLSSLENN